ncbi:MAG: aminotransferase class I/II-fold pyridoxal phosphate-dependent enzyme [Candidatus Kaelpia aquatica]|nr:aminotransferase class I/II-fold pyridoxal phosphate-dependent enzyme [Candidatus Kaelpia aquatica]
MSIDISKKLKSIPPSGIREFFDLVLGMDDIISLGVGEPDFVTPWNISEAAIYALEKGYTSYTSNQGMESLRLDISNHLKKKYKLSYDHEDEILITVGTSEGYDLALRALINPGDEVLVPEPCYVSYLQVAKLVGAKPKYIDTTGHGFKLTPQLLKDSITKKTKLLVLNYPANPTGVSYRGSELKELAQIVKKYNLVVLSDEIYGDLTYDFKHIPFSTLPGMKERTVYINGFSKAYAMTGWRIGYACGPPEVIAAMSKIHQYTMLCAPIMSQIAASEALLKGDNALREMKREYLRRRNYVMERLIELGFSFPYPDGAFYVYASLLDKNFDGKKFSYELIKEKSVAVVPGVAFGRPENNKCYIRICYTAEFDKLKEALNRIEQFLKE